MFYLCSTCGTCGSSILRIIVLAVIGLPTNGNRGCTIWSHVLSPSMLDRAVIQTYSKLGACFLPVDHMGYLWAQYFLQLPNYALSDYPLTGPADIPSGRRFYLLLCWADPFFRHIRALGLCFACGPRGVAVDAVFLRILGLSVSGWIIL